MTLILKKNSNKNDFSQHILDIWLYLRALIFMVISKMKLASSHCDILGLVSTMF